MNDVILKAGKERSLLRRHPWVFSGAVEKITCPLRLYTAENDNSVLPSAQAMFINRVKKGQRILVKKTRHEIYRSTDDVLFPWWHEILGFLKE